LATWHQKYRSRRWQFSYGFVHPISSHALTGDSTALSKLDARFRHEDASPLARCQQAGRRNVGTSLIAAVGLLNKSCRFWTLARPASFRFARHERRCPLE
jgi:hypothetical protein